jgi:hypothetical protein
LTIETMLDLPMSTAPPATAAATAEPLAARVSCDVEARARETRRSAARRVTGIVSSAGDDASRSGMQIGRGGSARGRPSRLRRTARQRRPRTRHAASSVRSRDRRERFALRDERVGRVADAVEVVLPHDVG